jgi:hypothetical protein
MEGLWKHGLFVYTTRYRAMRILAILDTGEVVEYFHSDKMRPQLRSVCVLDDSELLAIEKFIDERDLLTKAKPNPEILLDTFTLNLNYRGKHVKIDDPFLPGDTTWNLKIEIRNFLLDILNKYEYTDELS